MKRLIPILTILSAVTLSADDLCFPPSVSNYRCSDCVQLGSFIAEEFDSPELALSRLMTLLPQQRTSAQVVTLSRSNTIALAWKSTQAERDARFGHVQRLIVFNHKTIPGHTWGEILKGGAGDYGLEYVNGKDVAIVSTNDPDTPIIVIERASVACPTTGRSRAVGK